MSLDKRWKFDQSWWNYSRGYGVPLHQRKAYDNVDMQGSVLDVGGGDLECASEKKKKDTFLVGLDISRKALEIAKRKNKDADVVCGDAEHLPFVDNSFDKVLSLGTTVYADNILESLREAKRVSKKDIILTFSHKDDTYFSAQNGYKVFDENELRKMLIEDLGLKIKTRSSGTSAEALITYTLKDLGIRSGTLPEDTKSLIYVECEKQTQ
jgi:ubiquinone/menaquinone biosynthesis C-methylase UbiE